MAREIENHKDQRTKEQENTSNIMVDLKYRFIRNFSRTSEAENIII